MFKHILMPADGSESISKERLTAVSNWRNVAA